MEEVGLVWSGEELLGDLSQGWPPVVPEADTGSQPQVPCNPSLDLHVLLGDNDKDNTDNMSSNNSSHCLELLGSAPRAGEDVSLTLQSSITWSHCTDK